MEHEQTLRVRVALLAIFSGHAALSLIYDALPPVLVPLANHFGGGGEGEIVAQLASSLPYFGVMIAGLLTPFPTAKWGIRNVLLVALILFGILGSAGAVIDSAQILLTTRFCLGLSVGTIITCCMSFVAINFDDVARARLTGWMLAFGCFCGVVFILISGLIASEFSWRAPFLLHGLVTVAFIIPVFSMDRAMPPPAKKGQLADLVRLNPTLGVFVLAIAMQALVGTFMIQLAFLVGSMPFGSPVSISWVFALIGVAATVSAYSYGRWFVRVRPPVVAAFGLSLVAIGTVTAALANSFYAFLMAAVVYGTGSAMAQASLFTWAMRTTPVDLATRAMGLMFTCLYFGTAAGPALMGKLPYILGVRNLFLIMAASILVGVSLMSIQAFVQRRPRR